MCRPRQRIEAAVLLHERLAPIVIPSPHIVLATGRVGPLVVHGDVEDKIQRADSEVVCGHVKNVLVSVLQVDVSVPVGLQVCNRMERINVP